jgi:hypothetical protein
MYPDTRTTARDKEEEMINLIFALIFFILGWQSHHRIHIMILRAKIHLIGMIAIRLDRSVKRTRRKILQLS